MRAFADKLMLEISIERVPENLTVPAAWQTNADHFRVGLWRPGAGEAQFQFSIQPAGVVERPDEYNILHNMAQALAFYEQHPTLSEWCAAQDTDPADVADMFYTFERDRQSLMRFFGEFYEEFISYGES